MVPTFYSLLEALQTPAASCRTLCDAEFARRADGSPALTRTSFFTEAPLVWCGARYLLCVPQCGSAIPRVERTAARMKHLHAECLTSYRILRDELAYTDSTGALRRCDAVLHRLPEGEPLAGCALMHDAGELLAALERLAGELAEIGFTHCNLKPDNLYLTPGGRLVPVRYHFARFDEPGGDEEAFAALREWIASHAGLGGQSVRDAIAPLYRAAGEPDCGYRGPMCEGLTCVCGESGYGFVDEAERVAIPLQYLWAGDFAEGRAMVETPTGMRLIDKQGRYVIEPRCEIVEYNAYTGCSRVRSEGLWARFDYLGRQQGPFTAVWQDDPVEEKA